VLPLFRLLLNRFHNARNSGDSLVSPSALAHPGERARARGRAHAWGYGAVADGNSGDWQDWGAVGPLLRADAGQTAEGTIQDQSVQVETRM